MCDVLEKLEAPDGPAEMLVETLGAHRAATASVGSYIRLPQAKSLGNSASIASRWGHPLVLKQVIWFLGCFCNRQLLVFK